MSVFQFETIKHVGMPEEIPEAIPILESQFNLICSGAPYIITIVQRDLERLATLAYQAEQMGRTSIFSSTQVIYKTISVRRQYG